MRYAATMSACLRVLVVVVSVFTAGLQACGEDTPTCTDCGDADGSATAETSGQCSINSQFLNGECVCFEGWGGDTCSTCAPGFVSEIGLCVPGCAPDTCAGHGVCSMVDGKASCVCEADWGEPFCQDCKPGFDEVSGVCVDLCADRDCSGRGICDAWSGYATCLCDTGYIGQDCEGCAPYYALEGGECELACKPDSCSGHGYCDGVTGEAVCTCQGLYLGESCSECPFGFADAGDECLEICVVSPCNNASCDPSTGEAVCTCYDTHEGTDCNSCVAGYQNLGNGACGANVVSLSADLNRTCAVLDNGTMRCWGSSITSGLGYPDVEKVGCDELPTYEAGAVAIGSVVTQVAVGPEHTCALLGDGTVHCYGSGDSGKLGYGNTDTIGDDEPVAAGGAVSVGGTVESVVVGPHNTCVIVTGGVVRCWGRGSDLFLTQNTLPVGDDELPSSIDPIDVGGPAAQIELGEQMACARRVDGAVRCWGNNGFGALGAGTSGAWLDPTTLADVALPGLAVDIAVGDWHACAVLQGGALHCWGINFQGTLGYGHTDNLGKEETPTDIGPVNVGGPVASVEASGNQTCAILTSGSLRCWGYFLGGNLGYPSLAENIGDDEVPADVGDINLPASVVDVTIADRHVCALLATGAVRCWGEDGYECRLGTAQPISPPATDPSVAADAVLFYAKP